MVYSSETPNIGQAALSRPSVAGSFQAWISR